MRVLIRILLLTIAFSGGGVLYAQPDGRPEEHVIKIVDAKLALKGVDQTGDYIIINYEIPFSGMVEIRLFNEEGEKIWQNQYSNVRGDNKIVLRASKFDPGKRYSYQLNYKTDEVTDKLEISGATEDI